MARQFERPLPGSAYTKAQRDAWGAEQDRARAVRAAQPKPIPAKRQSRAKSLIADVGGSTCFNSLVFTGGEVIAQFTDGSEYSYPMSRSDAKEWFDDPSLGGFFNDEVR